MLSRFAPVPLLLLVPFVWQAGLAMANRWVSEGQARKVARFPPLAVYRLE